MLPLILALTVVVYAVDTGASAARLAGVAYRRAPLVFSTPCLTCQLDRSTIPIYRT